MTKVNSWNEWDPLKHVIVGRIDSRMVGAPDAGMVLAGRMRPAAPLMKTALLRDAAGESFVGIARRIRVSSTTPQHYYRLHRECMADLEYRELYTQILSSALQTLHGERPPPPSACHRVP